MAQFFNIETFIKQHITQRSESFFTQDLQTYHQTLLNEIQGKTALVIGGAGTIGSSFVKQLMRYNPAKVVVVDTNENGLTELTRDVRSRNDITVPKEFITYPINFSDEVFYKLFEGNKPFDIVANFAAHKHVRSEKDVYCIEAMINNNVVNAKRLLDVLVANKPKHFFCVSTDKAANPVNIMGASKKLMEDLIMSYSNVLPIKTARFANVAFSNGSLLAGFIERMFKQQPLSCPSDVKRFFVSPEESGQICLLACILGDSGNIFFPKLDEGKDLVTFASAVPHFLNLFGLEVDECASENEAREKAANFNGNKYPVYFFKSESDGEKLYEEFYTDDEDYDVEKYYSLGVIKKGKTAEAENIQNVITEMKSLFANTQQINKQEVVDILNKAIPTFSHISTGISLDSKM
jgi:FlaA1/EpsC-like NDP-sugar epimerase